MAPTKDEILAMKAGPELNALVAKEILGCDLRGSKETFYWCACFDEVRQQRLPRHCYGGYNYSILSYSIDIREAWKVVERMKSDEVLLYRFGLALSEMSLNQDSRMIKADHITDLMRWLCSEAICKAALLAKLE